MVFTNNRTVSFWLSGLKATKKIYITLQDAPTCNRLVSIYLCNTPTPSAIMVVGKYTKRNKLIHSKTYSIDNINVLTPFLMKLHNKGYYQTCGLLKEVEEDE